MKGKIKKNNYLKKSILFHVLHKVNKQSGLIGKIFKIRLTTEKESFRIGDCHKLLLPLIKQWGPDEIIEVFII